MYYKKWYELNDKINHVADASVPNQLINKFE